VALANPIPDRRFGIEFNGFALLRNPPGIGLDGCYGSPALFLGLAGGADRDDVENLGLILLPAVDAGTGFLFLPREKRVLRAVVARWKEMKCGLAKRASQSCTAWIGLFGCKDKFGPATAAGDPHR
jgi:hypothetical protein